MSPEQWFEQGFDITPCRQKKAYTKDWQKKKLAAKDFKPGDNIDNPIAQKFIRKY